MELLRFLSEDQLRQLRQSNVNRGCPQMLSRIAPRSIKYKHDIAWHDENGHSHVRASLIVPSLTIPFRNYNLLLGMWQQIVMLEMDTRPRYRSIVFQIICE